MGWRLNFITMGFCLIAISSMSVISVLANPASQLLLNQGERAIKRTAYKRRSVFASKRLSLIRLMRRRLRVWGAAT